MRSIEAPKPHEWHSYLKMLNALHRNREQLRGCLRKYPLEVTCCAGYFFLQNCAQLDELIEQLEQVVITSRPERRGEQPYR